MSAEPSQPSVKQIENAGRENEPDGVMKIGRGFERLDPRRAIINAQHRSEPAEKIARRHQVRQEINLGAASSVHDFERRAIAVAPPATRSPTLTRTVASR